MTSWGIFRNAIMRRGHASTAVTSSPVTRAFIYTSTAYCYDVIWELLRVTSSGNLRNDVTEYIHSTLPEWYITTFGLYDTS